MPGIENYKHREVKIAELQDRFKTIIECYDCELSKFLEISTSLLESNESVMCENISSLNIILIFVDLSDTGYVYYLDDKSKMTTDDSNENKEMKEDNDKKEIKGHSLENSTLFNNGTSTDN